MEIRRYERWLNNGNLALIRALLAFRESDQCLTGTQHLLSEEKLRNVVVEKIRFLQVVTDVTLQEE